MILSIVIPSYQPSAYLLTTLRSIEIAAQSSMLPINVYLCLNGKQSNNDVSRAVASLSYDNINLITITSLETNSPHQSLNFAISQASEEYVWVMSDDDTIEPQSLKTLTISLNQRSVTIAVSNFNTIDSKDNILTKNVQGWTSDEHFSSSELNISVERSNFCYGTFSSLVIRRQDWFETEYLNNKAPSGMNFMLQVPELMSFGDHMLIAQPLYNYRLYDKRWQHNYNETFELDHISMPQIILLYRKFGVSKKVIKKLLYSNHKGLFQSFYNLRMFGNPSPSFLLAALRYNYTSFYFYFGLFIFVLPRTLLFRLKDLQVIQNTLKVRE